MSEATLIELLVGIIMILLGAIITMFVWWINTEIHRVRKEGQAGRQKLWIALKALFRRLNHIIDHGVMPEYVPKADELEVSKHLDSNGTHFDDWEAADADSAKR